MTRFDFYYKAALLNGILKRIYKSFPMKYDCTHLYSCYLFEIIAIFWREKSQNLLVLEPSFQEQRSKYLFFGNLFSTDSKDFSNLNLNFPIMRALTRQKGLLPLSWYDIRKNFNLNCFRWWETKKKSILENNSCWIRNWKKKNTI